MEGAAQRGLGEPANSSGAEPSNAGAADSADGGSGSSLGEGGGGDACAASGADEAVSCTDGCGFEGRWCDEEEANKSTCGVGYASHRRNKQWSDE